MLSLGQTHSCTCCVPVCVSLCVHARACVFCVDCEYVWLLVKENQARVEFSKSGFTFLTFQGLWVGCCWFEDPVVPGLRLSILLSFPLWFRNGAGALAILMVKKDREVLSLLFVGKAKAIHATILCLSPTTSH